MSTILRTLRNLRKIGLKEYGHQMQYMGDTKVGTYIGSDRYGNKYFENPEEELPRRFALLPSFPHTKNPVPLSSAIRALLSNAFSLHSANTMGGLCE